MVGTGARAALVALMPLLCGAARGQGVIDLLKPAWLQAAAAVRADIRDSAFAARGRRDGPGAVDAIFALALRETDGDVTRALLAATAACFDHGAIRVKLGPLRIPVPLTFESDSLAAATRASLPAILFDDSPPEGDRDKLQHFFGSAYIAWITRIAPASDAAGDLVEFMEPALIEGGTDDPRDLRADRAGRAFADAMRDAWYVAPSWFLHNAQ